MDQLKENGIWDGAPPGGRKDTEKLDRALVAGLILEVVLETAGSPGDPQAKSRLVKTQLQDALVSQLAGRVTLDRFRRLLHQVDRWFPLYYPLVATGSPGAGAGDRPEPGPATPAPSLSPPSALREDRLRAWFQEEGRGLLPRRPHRKLNRQGLWDFLVRTRGAWFRLRDFQQHFGVDRKTAWEYLQKFRVAGLLRHNQGRSAAVRYSLAPVFLRVKADLLEPQVRQALAGLPPQLAARVSGLLIITGGEAFWAAAWPPRLSPVSRRRVLKALETAGILAAVGRVGTNRMLKLASRWLQT